MPASKREVALELELHTENLPIITKAIEQAALVFGMESRDAMAFTLASEEIFSYLCTNTNGNHSVRMICKNGLYYIQLDFILTRSNLDLKALNLGTHIDLEDDNQLEEIGLLIAARSVDRFYFSEEQGRTMTLSLYKEKSYFPAERLVNRLLLEKDVFSINQPENEDIKFFCQLTSNITTETCVLPLFFHYPGKFVDMIRSGEYQVALAFDQQKEVIGGIVWKAQAQKTVEVFGPYLFARSEGMAEALIEHCLEQTGRTDAVGLINRCGTADLSIRYFEELGSLRHYKDNDRMVEITAYYRQLGEDLGQRIWAHPEVVPYLQAQYQKLALPRDLRLISNMGEQRNDHCVFSTEFGYEQVILRPLLSGRDVADNLNRHLQILIREKMWNIFFEIDLGVAWHSEMIPALLSKGFRPCLILPYASKADLLLLQYHAGDFI